MIEELARVDPSVSVMVDVQNTLVNIAIQGWGSEAQKSEYLPKLATVRFYLSNVSILTKSFLRIHLEVFVYQNGTVGVMLLLLKQKLRRKETNMF